MMRIEDEWITMNLARFLQEKITRPSEYYFHRS